MPHKKTLQLPSLLLATPCDLMLLGELEDCPTACLIVRLLSSFANPHIDKIKSLH